MPMHAPFTFDKLSKELFNQILEIDFMAPKIRNLRLAFLFSLKNKPDHLFKNF